MTPTTGPTVYEALRGAIAAVGGVDKDGFNTNQSLAFRSIEGTVAATRPALLGHQISLIPSFSFINSSDWDRGEGKSPLHRSELIGTFRVIGPSGDEFQFDTIGEAVDTEGRASNKAMSASTKNALLRLLQIGSGEDGDAHDAYPSAPAQPRQPRPEPESLSFVQGTGNLRRLGPRPVSPGDRTGDGRHWRR